MPIQITIIGLGQIGTSMGLALAKHNDLVTRVGHDKQHAFTRQAEKMGAIDRVDSNLPNSVRNANLVLLCLPIDQIEETIRLIAQDLPEGAESSSLTASPLMANDQKSPFWFTPLPVYSHAWAPSGLATTSLSPCAR